LTKKKSFEVFNFESLKYKKTQIDKRFEFNSLNIPKN